MKETKFKPSELGAIPEDWVEGIFSDFLATFSSGATPYRGIPQYFKGDVRWITSGELNYTTIFDTKEHISNDAVRNTHLQIHKPGTFLMAITGLEAEGTRGRCAMVGLPSTTNQSCLAINGTEKMGTSYLYYFYRYWADTLAFKFCQGTKQMSYTAKMVKKFPIYAPKEVNEQSRIASALSSIDNLLASLDKLIAKKQAIKQGAMQQLLTGKKRLKGFAEMWVEVKIGNVGSLLNTTINPQMTPNNLYHEYSMPAFDEGKHPIITQGQDMHSSRFAIKGEVLLVNKLNVRQKRIWYVHCCMQNSLCSMEFLPFISSKVDLKFLHYLLLTNKIVEDFKDMSKGTSNSQKRIVPNDFLEYKVVIPNNISEQRAIASVLTSMDNELAALTAKKQKYAAIKQGMMQQLLTGKIRLI